MKINDAISGGLALALALFVYLEAGTFRTMPGVPYGPGLFPKVIAVVTGLAGTILIAGSLLGETAQVSAAHPGWARTPRSYLLFGTSVGGTVAFALLAGPLGFMVAAFLLLAALLLVTRGPRMAGSSLVVAAIVVATTHLLFSEILLVPLPFGFLEALLAG
jgi:putative tricarboxylic transport membrane protein